MSYTDEQIQAYLSGDFSETEAVAFEEAMQQDSDLNERVRIFKEIDEFLTEDDWSLTDGGEDRKTVSEYRMFLSGNEGQSYKKTIGDSADKYFNESPGGKQVFLSFGRIAAAASVLILAITAIFWLTSEPSASTLYAAYHETAALPSLTNRDGNSGLEAYTKKISAGEYQAALDWLGAYIDGLPEPVNPQLYIHKGVLQLNLGQTDEAIKTFEQLRDSKSLDAEKAYWYLALAYLKKDRKGDAGKMLMQLKSSGSKFNRKAVDELLEELQ